jgi:mRNA interferase MazF
VVEDAESVPDRGDVVWISLNPQAGHEQAGRRPSVVLSRAVYNGRVGLVKGYPFEVPLPSGFSITGVVLADQVKSLDWRARRAEIAGRLPEAVVAEVLRKLGALLA